MLFNARLMTAAQTGHRHRHDSVRDNHRAKLVQETERRRFRHNLYISKRDAWRDENGYSPLPDDDPFAMGGSFQKLFRKNVGDPFILLSDIKPSGFSSGIVFMIVF